MKLNIAHIRTYGMLRLLAFGLGAIALFGLLAACGGGDEAPADDGGASDDGEASVDFADKQFEMFLPSPRFLAWNPVTLKRVVEDAYPNITLTLTDSTTNEVLVQIDKQPDQRGVHFMHQNDSIWNGYRAGEAVFPSNVPDPGEPALIAWGAYPASQYAMFSVDEDVNTIRDLDGKKVRLGLNPDDFSAVLWKTLFETAGVKPQWVITTEGSAQSMENGSAIATTSGMVYEIGLSGNWSGLLQIHNIRIVDQLKDVIEQMVKEHPNWDFVTPVRHCNSAFVAANSLSYPAIDPNYKGSMSVPGDNCTASFTSQAYGFWAFDDMDDEAVHAIVSAMIASPDEFISAYPGPPWVGEIWTERIGHFYSPQANFHPGAARAYEEAGVSYGQEGIDEWMGQRTDSNKWWLDFMPQ
jgi:TRAP-type uncharacterized transport system substrate-binding protein